MLSTEQLSLVSTETLRQLRFDIKNELKRRGANKRIIFAKNLQPKNFEDFKGFSKNAQNFNSNNLVSLVGLGNEIHHGQKYLSCLLKQDWSDIYTGGDIENKYYVYAHVDPSDKIFLATQDAGGNYGGTPFYIGKGTGQRAYDLKRNQGHGKKIKSTLEKGFTPENIVKIVFENLSECKALEIEAKLIYYFGTVYQHDRKNGVLYNLDIPKTPEFKGVMKKISVQGFYKKKSLELLKQDDI